MRSEVTAGPAALRRALYRALRLYCHRCDRIMWTWQKCPHNRRFSRL